MRKLIWVDDVFTVVTYTYFIFWAYPSPAVQNASNAVELSLHQNISLKCHSAFWGLRGK